jgi:serine/threonine protein kinase
MVGQQDVGVGDRYCPLCDRELGVEICPQHEVPTVALSSEVPLAIEPKTMAGTVFGKRYVIQRVLGEGAMGVVFAALQTSTRQRVALKVIRPGSGDARVGLMRFYREAQAVSAIDHPNVIRILDFGVDEQTRQPFLVMGLVAGESLFQVLRRGPLPERKTAQLLAQVAGALTPAHAKGIVHRDLKPENILIQALPEGAEHVIVVDFGFARLRDDDLACVTTPGSVIGTVPYMSPEQASGTEIDYRSDLFGLGCILHECLTGQVPFPDPNPVTALLSRISKDAPPLSDVLSDGRPPSAALRTIHRALLARAPSDRPRAAIVVHEILRLLAVGHTDAADRISLTWQGPLPDTSGVVAPTSGVWSFDDSTDLGEPSATTPLTNVPTVLEETTEHLADAAERSVIRPTLLPTEPPETSRLDEMDTEANLLETGTGVTRVRDPAALGVSELSSTSSGSSPICGEMLRLPDVIDERFDRNGYEAQLRGVDVIVFDFDRVTRITSLGVREWLKLIRTLDQVRYYCFIRCHSNAMMQFNFVEGFAGRGEVLSVFAPYTCPQCGDGLEILMDVQREKEKIALNALPSLHCSRCRVDAELEEIEYFDFINSSPAPNPHALALKLIASVAIEKRH